MQVLLSGLHRQKHRDLPQRRIRRMYHRILARHAKRRPVRNFWRQPGRICIQELRCASGMNVPRWQMRHGKKLQRQMRSHRQRCVIRYRRRQILRWKGSRRMHRCIRKRNMMIMRMHRKTGMRQMRRVRRSQMRITGSRRSRIMMTIT